MWQDAWGVAMAAREQTPTNADGLLPVYLRLSQAEREKLEREEKLKKLSEELLAANTKF